MMCVGIHLIVKCVYFRVTRYDYKTTVNIRVNHVFMFIDPFIFFFPVDKSTSLHIYFKTLTRHYLHYTIDISFYFTSIIIYNV